MAGRDGGTGDAVLHGGTGLRVDGLNVEEVAQAIISLLRERNLADIMGKRGLERVKESFGWEQVARKTMGILHGA